MGQSVTSVINTSFSGSSITPILLLWSWQNQEFFRSRKIGKYFGGIAGGTNAEMPGILDGLDLLALTNKSLPLRHIVMLQRFHGSKGQGRAQSAKWRIIKRNGSAI
jgi:hypothetical protein